MAEEKQADPHNPQVLFAWVAPLRPYIKRSKTIVRFYLALTLLLSLIIVFFGDYILIIPLLTLLFIFYVFTVTPPTDVTHKITTFGIETAGETIRWEALDHFYFTERLGYEMLTLVTHPPVSHHVYLVIPDEIIKKRVIEELSKHIVFQPEAQKTVTDRLINWFLRLVPEEHVERKKQAPYTPVSPHIEPASPQRSGAQSP